MASLVPLRTGVSLEVKLSPPANSGNGHANSRDEHKLAVCRHPWSWLGGRMDDPVLCALMEPALRARGYHVLRYNSRGVGRSTGWASFTGASEAGDLAALVEWAVAAVGDVQSVVVLGYSYGALIASLQPVLPGVQTSHVLISYPLAVRGWLTLFRARYEEQLAKLLRDPAANVLVVFGDHDEFTAAARYRAWRGSLEGSDNCKWAEVRDGTHFWRDSDGDELVKVVSEWLP
ncbi:Alpha/Beta hydrolase protein [Mycena latifolia]|nr:Alpha/Beta hydrolase protein [Mycena latifolia]